nr:LysM peptidoglycan-binding domain-containing protein [Streptomyces sp. HUCO-GS316]
MYQTWLVRAGDTIDGIAHRVYGAVEFWRPVAEANHLANPRSLVPGTVLVLPPKAG